MSPPIESLRPLQNLIIPLRDGTTLAASLITPGGDGPFPTLISFYPYRKDDFMGAGTAWAREYFAQAGYACLLVDIRGYGSSSGRAYQAWDPREFDDGAEVVEWAARQDWSSGRIGVWGSSYGGAQALGIASRRPPALKAIASVYGAADIYQDFVYPGGCPNDLGAAAWGALVTAKELAPPSLQDAQGRWLDVWRERLERLDDKDISSMVWPAHPQDDEYWRSRRIHVEAIEVPSFFLAGWRDLLCQGMIDAYQRCTARKRLLAGPWTHSAPDVSTEAPFDWLLELRNWFDVWVAGNSAAQASPPVIYFVQGCGEWRKAQQWPPEPQTQLVQHPGVDGVLAASASDVNCTYASKALVGLEAGLWYPMGVNLQGSFDQTRDDAKSLTFTSEPLAQDIEIAGYPRARVHVQVAGGMPAHLCLKLCHVGPDDRSTLISSGWKMVPQAPQAQLREFEVVLYPTAYRVPRGHRLRWVLSCADFPRLWPTVEKPTLSLISRVDRPCVFETPVCVSDSHEPHEPAVPPTGVNRAPWTTQAKPIYRVERDAACEGVSITAGVELTLRLPLGGTFSLSHSVTAQLREAQPAAAVIRTQAQIDMEMASGERFQVNASGYATHGRRHLEGRVSAGGQTLYENRWSTFNGR